MSDAIDAVATGFLGDDMQTISSTRRAMPRLNESTAAAPRSTEVREQPEILSLVLDHLDEAVYFVDTERRITLWNKAAETTTGWTSGDVLGRHCADGLLRHCDSAGDILCGRGCPLLSAISDGQARTAHVFMLRRDGARIPVHVRVAPIRNRAGAIDGCIEIFHNDSSRLAVIDQIEQLRDQAMMDSLTGLPNRRFLVDRFADMLKTTSEHKHPLAVIFLDLDHFKEVNDTFGHEKGDEVLRITAATLGANLRSPDVIVRWGGEEFVIVAPGLSGEELERFAERLRVLIERCEVGRPGLNISVTASIGCTTAREGEEWIEILARADALMYASKKAGRNRVTGD